MCIDLCCLCGLAHCLGSLGVSLTCEAARVEGKQKGFLELLKFSKLSVWG